MDARSARRSSYGRERESSSPERAKVMTRSMQLQPPKVKPIRKVQVVYYLSRNGQLEHPHYIEVTHLANQQLRLKDFMDRLTVLRGKGMPSLYSWSCKRSYKNGYVWNDLAENDIICPSDGAEYVLKGSEVLDGCTERFQQQLQMDHKNRRPAQDPHFQPRRKQPSQSPPTSQLHETHHPNYEYQHFEAEAEEEDPQELEFEDEEKTSFTSSTTSQSRCSRGVSTDELLLENNSDQKIISTNKNGNLSQRFEDGDPVETGGRNSVLLQLISCGNLAVTKAYKNNVPSISSASANNNSNNVVMRKSRGGESDQLRKGVLYKTAAANKNVGDPVQKDEDMIRYMSENPRFGNLQSEEKEYFSGSIVESISSENRVMVGEACALKRSNSDGEDRGSKAGLDEETAANEDGKDGAAEAVKGKCIPRKISLLTSKPTKK